MATLECVVASAVDALSQVTAQCADHASTRVTKAAAMTSALAPGNGVTGAGGRAREASAATDLCDARDDLLRATASAKEHAAFYALAEATALAEYAAAVAAAEAEAEAEGGRGFDGGSTPITSTRRTQKPTRPSARSSGTRGSGGGSAPLANQRGTGMSAMFGQSAGPNDEHLQDL